MDFEDINYDIRMYKRLIEKTCNIKSSIILTHISLTYRTTYRYIISYHYYYLYLKYLSFFFINSFEKGYIYKGYTSRMLI